MPVNNNLEPFHIKLVWWYWLTAVVCIPFTLGVASIVLWWTARYRYPRIIDIEGITKGNGKRVLWKDLTRIQKIRVVNQRREKVAGSVDLYFGNEMVKINPYVFIDGFKVLDYVRQVSGQNLDVD